MKKKLKYIDIYKYPTLVISSTAISAFLLAITIGIPLHNLILERKESEISILSRQISELEKSCKERVSVLEKTNSSLMKENKYLKDDIVEGIDYKSLLSENRKLKEENTKLYNSSRDIKNKLLECEKNEANISNFKKVMAQNFELMTEISQLKSNNEKLKQENTTFRTLLPGYGSIEAFAADNLVCNLMKFFIQNTGNWISTEQIIAWNEEAKEYPSSTLQRKLIEMSKLGLIREKMDPLNKDMVFTLNDGLSVDLFTYFKNKELMP